MHPNLKLTKLVIRPDGKYDCEVSVLGYWHSYPVEDNWRTKGFTALTKGQKVILTIEIEDLGEDLIFLIDNIRDYIDSNKEAMLATWTAIENSCLQVETEEQKFTKAYDEAYGTSASPEAQQAACNGDVCSFPECNHTCNYNPDKDDRPVSVNYQRCHVCNGKGGYACNNGCDWRQCKACNGTGNRNSSVTIKG